MKPTVSGFCARAFIPNDAAMVATPPAPTHWITWRRLCIDELMSRFLLGLSRPAWGRWRWWCARAHCERRVGTRLMYGLVYKQGMGHRALGAQRARGTKRWRRGVW